MKAFPLCAAALAAMLAGCAGSEDADLRAGLSCVDDSPNCVGKRQSTLRHFTTGPDRAWVNETPTPATYASGVRLFAFKMKKGDLTCAELAAGRREAQGAPQALRSGAGLTPAQVSRGKMFAAEVGRELNREHAKRCKS